MPRRYSYTLSLTSALDKGGCRNSRPLPGFDLQRVQPIASHYTDWAIPAHPILTAHFTTDLKLLLKTQSCIFTVSCTHTHTHTHISCCKVLFGSTLKPTQIPNMWSVGFDSKTGLLTKCITEKRVLFASGWLSVFEIGGDCSHIFKLCQQHNIYC